MQSIGNVDQLLRYAWRVSPLSAAVHLSGLEGEVPQFEPAPHLEQISNAIVDAVDGNGPSHLIISMPPRHGKSTLVTRRSPQWYLSKHPEHTVGMCGYGGDFAREWGRKVRNEIHHHKDLLGFSLAEDSQKADQWHTQYGGGMWTAGVNGQITGKGADFLVIDDPIKSFKEAHSPIYRQQLWDWWMGDVMTRTYPHSVIIVVMTRWHSDDLVGRLLSHEYPGDPAMWKVIDLPAIWDQKKPDAIGRKEGEALWPSHFPVEWLTSERKDSMTEEVWQSLYQQKPMNKTGIGAVYAHFEEETHVRTIERDERLKIIWSLDFNVDPMCSVIAQVTEMNTSSLYEILTGKKTRVIEVMDEICLNNSRTLEACEEFDARVQKIARGKRFKLEVYGDATANRRDTRGDDSDWEQIWRFLSSRGYDFSNMVRSSNMPVRARVNAMNAALRSASGVVSLYVAPKCKELRTDLKEVMWKRDSMGNTTSQLDNSDKKRTHVSDALGYYIQTMFSITGTSGERSGLLR